MDAATDRPEKQKALPPPRLIYQGRKRLSELPPPSRPLDVEDPVHFGGRNRSPKSQADTSSRITAWDHRRFIRTNSLEWITPRRDGAEPPKQLYGNRNDVGDIHTRRSRDARPCPDSKVGAYLAQYKGTSPPCQRSTRDCPCGSASPGSSPRCAPSAVIIPPSAPAAP